MADKFEEFEKNCLYKCMVPSPSEADSVIVAVILTTYTQGEEYITQIIPRVNGTNLLKGDLIRKTLRPVGDDLYYKMKMDVPLG